MKNKLIAFFLLTSLLGVTSFAQTWEGGFGYHQMHQTGTLLASYNPGTFYGNVNTNNPVNEKYGSFGFQAIYNYPLKKFSDDLSLGLQPGFMFFAYYQKKPDVLNFYGQTLSAGSSNLILGYQMPAYINIRYGNGATKDSKSDFGFGLDVGGMLTGFNIPNEKGIFFSPAIGAEIKFKQVGLRFDLPFLKYSSVYKSYTGDIPRLKTSFFSVYLTLNLSKD